MTDDVRRAVTAAIQAGDTVWAPATDTTPDKNRAEIANQQVSGGDGADTAEPAGDAGGEVERRVSLT